jgi:hypothetical protein
LGLSSLLSGAVIIVLNQQTDKDGFTLSNIRGIKISTYAYAIGPQGWEEQSKFEDLMEKSFDLILVVELLCEICGKPLGFREKLLNRA